MFAAPYIATSARSVHLMLFALALLGLTACASSSPSNDEETTPVRSEYDPWEPMNRSIYAFNDAIDRATLKPIAKGYRKIVPRFARRGVSNFSDNLLVPRSALNNFLQGKGGAGFQDIGRFLVNSTLGIGGLFDIASESGVPEHDETFSQTLAVWGVPEGPYVYLPFLGPKTLLSAATLPIDMLSDPMTHYDNTSVRDKLRVLKIIDIRARLLSADVLIEDSKDPYLTVRESYLQNREFVIYDGDPPSDEEDDLFDEFFNE